LKTLFIRMGSIGLLAVLMSVSALSQRGTRGSTRGNPPAQNAGDSAIAQQRREIREKERAAIAQIGQTLRQALQKAQIDAKNAQTDADKAAAKEEVQTAHSNHRAALDRIRQETAAALAALGH
jgi:hypothetical protein